MASRKASGTHSPKATRSKPSADARNALPRQGASATGA